MPRRHDTTIERILLVLLDLMALFLAANLSFDLRYQLDWGPLSGTVFRAGSAPWGALYQALPYMLLGWFVIFSTFGLYRVNLSRREELALIIKAQLIAFALIFATAFFYRGFSYSRGAAAFLVPLAFLFTVGFRSLFHSAKEYLLKLGVVRERVVLVGLSDETQTLIARLQRGDNPYELVGVITKNGGELPEGARRLGSLNDLEDIIRDQEIDRVLLISGDLSHEELIQSIDTALSCHVPWAVVPDLYDLLLDRLHLGEVAGIPVMGPHGSNIVGMNRVAKRAIDLGAATFLIALLSPIMLLVAAVIKLTSKGPVLFVQDRVGRLGRPFRFYKFRTMVVNGDDQVHRELMAGVIQNNEAGDVHRGKPVYKQVNDPRITAVGRWLRRFSVDELPQLFNVFKGDMSLIGPRPAIQYEVDKYRERHRRRLEAQPGITGLWQVSGRNRLSFEQMVELDIQYIENWSLGLDVRIFFKTLAAVLLSRGY